MHVETPRRGIQYLNISLPIALGILHHTSDQGYTSSRVISPEEFLEQRHMLPFNAKFNLSCMVVEIIYSIIY